MELKSCTLLILFISSNTLMVMAEDECFCQTTWCYECDSDSDIRCLDPFNKTADPGQMPLLKQCHGTCVKILTTRNKDKIFIRRTCTSSIQIDLFMVNQVCMKESGGQGHMCFCESDACNKTTRLTFSWTLFFFAMSLITISLSTSILSTSHSRQK